MIPTVESFGLALPPGWVKFPLEDGDFHDFVRVQRKRLAEEASLSRTAQRQFEIMMRQLRNDCESAGVRLVATAMRPTNPEDESSELDLLTCTITVLSRGEMGSQLPLTVNTIMVGMSRERPASDDGSTLSDLDPPSVVSLPAGEAVKIVRLHTYKVTVEEGGRLSVFVQHFLVPINEGEDAVVVSFATPNVAHAKPLSSLFDQMMSTFRTFAGDDDITDPAGTDSYGAEEAS